MAESNAPFGNANLILSFGNVYYAIYYSYLFVFDLLQLLLEFSIFLILSLL